MARILVGDDDRTILGILQGFLAAGGSEVVPAGWGNQALRLCRKSQPALAGRGAPANGLAPAAEPSTIAGGTAEAHRLREAPACRSARARARPHAGHQGLAG